MYKIPPTKMVWSCLKNSKPKMPKQITTAALKRRSERGNHVKDRETRFKRIKYNANKKEVDYGQRPSRMEKDDWKPRSQLTVALKKKKKKKKNR
jgi:hypothetical protein